MLEAIRKEIFTEKDFLEGSELGTIYFGGGTPSILNISDIDLLLETIHKNFTVDKQAEITLEANPDDLNPEYLSGVVNLGINRLSIGIQSFHDEDLEFMNRRHNSDQAKACIEMARIAGIENLNLDLIYGLPGMNNEKWEKNLETALGFVPPHLAAYHLSYETGTVLDYSRKKKKIMPVDEDRSLDHYEILCNMTDAKGYDHYEISNFAFPGSISKHNSAYWRGKKYLGVGPSAHSYNGQTRRWNMAKNSSYIRGIFNGNKVYDEESLNEMSKLHDYIMTSMRTMWGADLKFIRNEWGEEHFNHVCLKAEPFIKTGKILIAGDKLIPTRGGMFIVDHIIGELFL